MPINTKSTADFTFSNRINYIQVRTFRASLSGIFSLHFFNSLSELGV